MNSIRDRVRAVIYDFDGTIIATEALHETAWKVTAERFGVTLTPEMLLDQKGRPGREFALEVIGEDHPEVAASFAKEKARYFREHLHEIRFCSGFLDTQEILSRRGVIAWICSSADRAFIDHCLRLLPELEPFRECVVTLDMYERGKPSAEPLLVTLRLMGGLPPQDAVYVGDAHSDYCSARNAGMRFVYFNPIDSRRDARIPEHIPTIQDHREILGIVVQP